MRYAHPELLTEASDLAEAAGGETLRVIDATVHLRPAENGYRAESGLDGYRQGHIPGAAFMDLIRTFSDPSTGLGFSLPDAGRLAESLGGLGIGRDHRVVIYSHGHMMWATRAFWLLHYAGLDDVAVLNGGLGAWTDAGYALASGDEHYPATTFEARPRPERFADREQTRAAMGDAAVCTLNALSPEVYAGTGEMHYGRRGHIPGSRNLHYDRLLEGQRFRPADELRNALDSSGALGASRVVTYCGGGISATIDAFACLLLGKDDVAVYDGSMAEWARDESLPLETGPDAGAATPPPKA